MSQEERDKLEWLKRAKDKLISQREAGEKIGVSDRWVRKLLKRMRQRGDAVVVHGLRGRASNRKIPAETQARVLDLVKHPTGTILGQPSPPSSCGSNIRSRSARRRCAAG